LSTEETVFDPRNLAAYDTKLFEAGKMLIRIAVNHIEYLEQTKNATLKRDVQTQVLKKHVDFLIEDNEEYDAPFKNPFDMLYFANSTSR